MIKHLANILTTLRIVLALILLIFFKKISVLFLIIYTIAEFTDMIDGTIARKTGSCSHTGAVLDSVADLLLSFNLIKIVFSMKLITKKLSIWLIASLLIGMLSPIINFVKHKKIFFIHAISCKAFGAFLLAVPFAIYFGFIDMYLPLALVLLTISMTEIFIISILLHEPDPNARSIYSLIKTKVTT